MEPTNITVKILTDIREEMTGMREDMTGMREGMRENTEEIRRLGQRQVDGDVRTATILTEVSSDLRDVKNLLKEQLDLRGRVEKCELDIREIKSAL